MLVVHANATNYDFHFKRFTLLSIKHHAWRMHAVRFCVNGLSEFEHISC